MRLGTALIVASSCTFAASAWSQELKEGTAAGLPTPAAGGPVDERLGKAAEAARRGELDAALALIREAAEGRDGWPPPRLILARMLFQADQPAAARRSLEQAAAESPDDASVYLTFATLALAEGRLNDARLNAEQALAVSKASKLDGEPARVVLRDSRGALAAVAEARGDWPAARDNLTAWLEVEPKDGPARARLGRALFQLGRAEDAFRELQKASADAPKLVPPGVAMALLWAQKGDAATAAKWYDYALKADPKDAQARLACARWRLDRGEIDEARPLVEEAAGLAPDSREVPRFRGLIAWQGRDFPAAERAFEAIHREEPADIAVADVLARSLAEQEDPEKRARALQLALANARQASKSAEVLATLGRAHHRLGHLDEAERILRAATAGGQASPDTAYFLACVLADRGKSDEARLLLQKATSGSVPFAYRPEATSRLASP